MSYRPSNDVYLHLTYYWLDDLISHDTLMIIREEYGRLDL